MDRLLSYHDKLNTVFQPIFGMSGRQNEVKVHCLLIFQLQED